MELKGPGAPAFNMHRDTAIMLRTDLVAAGCRLTDEDGYELRFHSFRHTCATWLFKAGMHPQHIRAITGHKDMATLTNRYGHLDVDQARTALAGLPEIKRGATA